jgi:hypothetical protein
VRPHDRIAFRSRSVPTPSTSTVYSDISKDTWGEGRREGEWKRGRVRGRGGRMRGREEGRGGRMRGREEVLSGREFNWSGRER